MSKGIGGRVGSGGSTGKAIPGRVGQSSNNDTANNGNNTQPSSGSGDCFVATAAFGTPWAEEIQYLRHFRDHKLRHYRIGRAFIAFYYRKGPRAAVFLNDRAPALKPVVRRIIKAAIWVVK